MDQSPNSQQNGVSPEPAESPVQLNPEQMPPKTNRKMMMMAALGAVFFLAVGGAVAYFLTKDDDTDTGDTSTTSTETADNPENSQSSQQPVAYTPTIESSYLSDYTLSDDEFGTDVKVTISSDTRTIDANALPNHDTGEFPNDANPNTISAQDNMYEIPLQPTFTGGAQFAREPGVAINGVKFEPQTAERVVCDSGQTYSVEAIQDYLDLGLDNNNAHVQPTGAYHYHGVSKNLVSFAAVEGQDLVHVGFAHDGHLMLYSQSGAYKSSHGLVAEKREGTGCTITMKDTKDVTVDGTTPDGTYVSDWVYNEGSGDLDDCNGATIDGQYVYIVTDEFPYIPRCLNGEASDAGGGQPEGGGDGQQSGPPSGSNGQQGPPSGGSGQQGPPQ